jgi:ABC-2 type transport system ATP-binding protein
VTTYALQTFELVKTYNTGISLFGKKTNAVNALSLNVPEGSIYGLLGRNSAGKTTTIRMAMGLARPTRGSIRVFGLDPARDPERVTVLQQVAYVPEDKVLVASFTVRRLLELNRAFYSSTWSDDIARKVCQRLELPLDLAFVRASLGNKTKTALVAAIAQRSRLLILDEPTTGLDPLVLDELLRLLVEDCTAEGRTVFLSTHQLPEIEKIADYIGIMDRGKLLLEGRLDDIRSSFRRLTVRGASLPGTGPQILSATCNTDATQYILQRDPDEFERLLVADGANVIESVPLSLSEIFLELCRTSEEVEDEQAIL